MLVRRYTKTGNLLASPWKFAKHGQSGTEVSELLPRVAAHVDEICVVRSLVADNSFELRLIERQWLAVILGQSRLGIKQIYMRWSARHVEKNNPFRPRDMMRRTNRKRPRRSVALSPNWRAGLGG